MKKGIFFPIRERVCVALTNVLCWRCEVLPSGGASEARGCVAGRSSETLPRATPHTRVNARKNDFPSALLGSWLRPLPIIKDWLTREKQKKKRVWQYVSLLFTWKGPWKTEELPQNGPSHHPIPSPAEDDAKGGRQLRGVGGGEQEKHKTQGQGCPGDLSPSPLHRWVSGDRVILSSCCGGRQPCTWRSPLQKATSATLFSEILPCLWPLENTQPKGLSMPEAYFGAVYLVHLHVCTFLLTNIF